MTRHLARPARLFTAAAIASVAVSAAAQDVSNSAILQWFESSYVTQAHRSVDLFKAGYGAVWIPPTGRADLNDFSVGYDQYDRWELGSAGRTTLYGSEAGLREIAGRFDRLGVDLHVDITLNHAGFSDQSTSGFVNGGGYPGFVVTDPSAIDGDFHSSFAGGDLNGRLAGLIDFDHTTNLQLIRHPVEASPTNGTNITAGTTPDAFGRLANQVDPNNARLYPDLSGSSTTFTNSFGQQATRYDFNTATPLAGDAVPENVLGALNRHVQWLVQEIGVDGFRLDAVKHFEPFVLQAFDDAVFRSNPRLNLDGSVKDVFSYGEVLDGNTGFINSFTRKDINPNNPGQSGGNRDALDYALFFSLRDNLSFNGLQNDWNNVVNAGMDVADDGLHNGSRGVLFVDNHDTDFKPQLQNLAHAYILTQPGEAVVYYNQKEHGDNRSFPHEGTDDALGNNSDAITTLLSIRNSHGRGNYQPRLLEKETLIYERESSALVVLSNRGDAGFDQRTVGTGFASGTALIELTGNAANESNIPEIVLVGSGGNATVRALRDDGQDKGYLIYGVATPRSSTGIQFSNVDSILGPDAVALTIDTDADNIPDAASNRDIGRARLASLSVIKDDSFTVSIATDAVTLSGGFLNPVTNQIENINIRDHDADGDFAVLKINGGIDLNNNGVVDFTNPGSVTYGFENFTTANDGFSDANGNGFFSQTIDATALPEGESFITVRAFRHRNSATGGDGGESVFTDFREAVYIDRLLPESELANITAFSGDGNDLDFDFRSLDRTADEVHVFLNLGEAVTDGEILSFLDSSNQATRRDIETFRFGYFNVGAGNVALTVVTVEETGTTNIQRFTGIDTGTTRGAGFGDVNHNGFINASDITNSGSNFETFLYSRGQLFNAASDFEGDGDVDTFDLLALGDTIDAQPVFNPVTVAAYNTIRDRRGDLNGNTSLDEFDLFFLRDNLGLDQAANEEAFWNLDLNPDGVLDGNDAELLVTEFLGEITGDLTRDGVIDLDDANALVLALTDINAYQTLYSINALVTADINRDFVFNLSDIQPFLALYGSNASAAAQAIANGLAIPEPTTGLLLAAAAVGFTRRRRRRGNA